MRYGFSLSARFLFVVMMACFSNGYGADVNVLIIGSSKDTSADRRVKGKSIAFTPVEIKNELQKILAGAGFGKVSVVLEDRCSAGSDADLEAQLDANLRLRTPKGGKPPQYTPEQRKRIIESMRKRGSPCYNLATWFHWPYPPEVETQKRWPNLRGEKGTKWDYVVLIGDPYTIEYMPGLYTHGVAQIAEEVAKGKAETILLMPWPGKGSESTVDHYKEVVYRTGRSGGIKVAPAGLAWQAAHSTTLRAGIKVGDTHPSKEGAYIAAATIYSRIWNKSASTSTYAPNKALANTVHKTVTANVGRKQYSGTFDFQSPFRCFTRKERKVSPGKSPGGSSTEGMLCNATAKAIGRAGGAPKDSKGASFRIGRDSYSPNRGKDYRLGDKGYKNTTFAYRYQTNNGTPEIHLSQIFSQDVDLADQVMHESKTFRVIPRRLTWAWQHQINPKVKAMGGHGHLSNDAVIACGTYIHTIYSGRCPVNPKPEKVTDDWVAQKVGYVTAWRVATCQTRAPGFKVLPSDNSRFTVDTKNPETMTVQFIMKPQNNVTVTVASSDEKIALVSPKTLTFTTATHNTPQKVLVKLAVGAAAGTKFNVRFKTSSDDEVCDDLVDTWEYHVNTPPVANRLEATVFAGRPTGIVLKGSDTDGEALTYTVATKPTNGSIEVSPNGAAAYTPMQGYTGTDIFTFTCNDGSVDSKPAMVTLTVVTPSLYGSNLLKNGSGELAPLTKYYWIESDGKWTQNGSAMDGLYTIGATDGVEAELSQEVDVSDYSKTIQAGKQSFKTSALVSLRRGEVKMTVEFLDASKKVLLSKELSEGKAGKKAKMKPYESTQVAPSGTTSIRVRLFSSTKPKRSRHAQFDRVELIALMPEN